MNEQRFWRTLVRVAGVQRGGVWLCVPGWNSRVSVLRSIDELKDTQPGARFFARVNIGASDPDELQFKDIEALDPDPEPDAGETIKLRAEDLPNPRRIV